MAKHESDLIDQYIDALLHDPQAPPPVGLSDDIGQFVRTLVLAESKLVNQQISNNIQARVWQKARIAAQVSAKAAAQIQKREQRMIANNRLSVRNPFLNRLIAPSALTLVTVMIVVGFVAVAAAYLSRTQTPSGGSGDGGNNTNGAAAGSQQQITGTPTPAASVVPAASGTALPTATPIDWQSTDPNATPILVPSVLAIEATATATPIGWQPFDTNATPTIVPRDVLPSTMLPPTAVPPLPLPLPPAEKRDLNQVITESLTVEQPVKVYEFEIAEDGMISAFLSSPNFSGVLSYQYVEAEVSGGGGSGGGGGGGGSDYIPQSQLVTYVRRGGILTLIVSSTQLGMYGEFQLSVFATTPQPISVGTPTNAVIDERQQVLVYTFQGVQGSLVDISVTGEGSIDLSMTLVEIPTMQGSLTFYGSGSGCLNGINLYCGDDDSGSGSNPEMTGVLIRFPVLHAIILHPAYPLTDPVQPSEVVVRLDRREPVDMNDGSGLIKLSSQVRANAVTLDGTVSTPITLTLSHNSGGIPVEITVLQDGYVLQQTTLIPQQVGALTIVPALDSTIMVMAQYSSSYSSSYGSAGMNPPPMEIAVTMR